MQFPLSLAEIALYGVIGTTAAITGWGLAYTADHQLIMDGPTPTPVYTPEIYHWPPTPTPTPIIPENWTRR